MAFRIEESVIRGEIDNRVKGTVCGRIWVEGRVEPVTLELEGNAWPDLAGCLLKFTNPRKRIKDPRLEKLHPVQRGSIGDLTASRKVRIFNLPAEEAYLMSKRGEKPPEKMANCLYLEWFSEANGRVVIESVDYELWISAPEWQMTHDENEARAEQAASGMNRFIQKLTDAINKHQRGKKDPEQEEWDEHDYERFMRECDARTEKFSELLDKYGASDEAEEMIADEMGWLPPLTGEEAEEQSQHIDEINRACEEALNEPPPEPDPHREGVDWIRNKNGDIRHPLQHRCFESAIKFSDEAEQLGLDESDDPDFGEFIFEFQTTGAKLAGALNSFARGLEFCDGAFTVAYLKRALDHLHKAQSALEAVAVKNLLPVKLVSEARKELFEIREGILKLMDEFRNR
jgi:hypothetical protein